MSSLIKLPKQSDHVHCALCLLHCTCCMQNPSMRLSPLVPLEQVNTNLQANHCYAAVAALTTICHLPALPTILPTTNCGPFPFLCLLTSFQIDSMKMAETTKRVFAFLANVLSARHKYLTLLRSSWSNFGAINYTFW